MYNDKETLEILQRDIDLIEIWLNNKQPTTKFKYTDDLFENPRVLLAILTTTGTKLKDEDISAMQKKLQTYREDFDKKINETYTKKIETLDSSIKEFLKAEISKLDKKGNTGKEKAKQIKIAVNDLTNPNMHSVTNYQTIIEALEIQRGWTTPKSIAEFKKILNSLNTNTIETPSNNPLRSP